MKILTIVPSIYPNKLKNMLYSYYSTVHTPNIIINSEIKSITTIYNEIFKEYNDFDFYHLTNDDVEYKTKNWDLKLANKGKISYGDDLLQRSNLCTFPMIDGNIARSVGWLQMPTLNRYCGDVVWNFIGKQMGILNYVPEVIIKHHWEGADDNINKSDSEEFARWLPWSFKDVEKIRRVL